ncbi:MAG: response regulator [Chloroflexota bacterium]
MTRRILVVNDEQDFVEMVKLFLEGEGYEVRSADRGDTALPLIREWQPHLVLLDLRMAGLSGWETLDEIEADANLAATHVLITSGAVEEAAAQRQRLHGRGNDYIGLPFDLDDFLRKVRNLAGEPASA